MILSDSDAIKRLSSPLNLINRLSARKTARSSAMNLFGMLSTEKKEVKTSFNIFDTNKLEPTKTETKTLQVISSDVHPTVDTLINNHESQVKLGLAHDSALEVLNRSVTMLSTKLDEVRADKLPSVITAASKVVESIRKERSEASKNAKDRDVHFHFYTPQQKSINDYEVIDITT
jgi:hypothetical protein